MFDALEWQRRFYDQSGSKEAVEFVSSLNRYADSPHPVYAGKRADCEQCHREPPSKAKAPDQGFYTGKVAMMLGGPWQVGPNHIARIQPGLDYGVAPFPPPADHPERANTSVVQGAVVVLPTGAQDLRAAADLLAWMMSPEIMADMAFARARLPVRRTAAMDPRFRQIPGLDVFLDLVAHPNAVHPVTTPLSAELNATLNRTEREVLHQDGDPALLLDELQFEFKHKLEQALD